jgi:hypothetical protein
MRQHVLRKPSSEFLDDAPEQVRQSRGDWFLLGEQVCLKSWIKIHGLGIFL